MFIFAVSIKTKTTFTATTVVQGVWETEEQALENAHRSLGHFIGDDTEIGVVKMVAADPMYNQLGWF